MNEQNPAAAPVQATHRFQVGDTVRVYEPGLGDYTGPVERIESDGADGFWMYVTTEPHHDAFGSIVSYAVARLDANHDPRFGYMLVELVTAAEQPETQAQAPARRFQVGDTVRISAYGNDGHTGKVTELRPDAYDGFWLYIATAPHQDKFGATVTTMFARLGGDHTPRPGYTVELLQAADAAAVTPAAGALIPAGAAELLDTLPVGTIIRDADTATLWEREPNNWVCSVPWEAYYRSSAEMAHLGPFTVLHVPSAAPAPAPAPATPAAQAAAWAASCEALNAASATERLAALQDTVETTVSHLERAELVTDDYRYTPRLDVGEFRIVTGNLEFRAMMTGSLDTPAAHFLVTTTDDDDPGIAMRRTTTDLGAIRAWLMSWTVTAMLRSADA